MMSLSSHNIRNVPVDSLTNVCCHFFVHRIFICCFIRQLRRNTEKINETKSKSRGEPKKKSFFYNYLQFCNFLLCVFSSLWGFDGMYLKDGVCNGKFSNCGTIYRSIMSCKKLAENMKNENQ